MRVHNLFDVAVLIILANGEHEAWTEAAFQVFGIWLQTPYEHFAFIYQGRMKKVYYNGQFFFPTYDGFILSMGNMGDPKSISYMYQKGDYAEHNNGDSYDEHYSYPMIVYSRSNPEKIYL